MADRPHPHPAPAAPSTDDAIWVAINNRGDDHEAVLAACRDGAQVHTAAIPWTPLHGAAFTGQPRICTILLDHGASVHARDGDHNTPLHLAARFGHVEVCRILLAHGAAIDVLNDIGATPFNQAAHGNHPGVCDLLLRQGADPLIATTTGRRADPDLAHIRRMLRVDPESRDRIRVHALRHLGDQPAESARVLVLMSNQTW